MRERLNRLEQIYESAIRGDEALAALQVLSGSTSSVSGEDDVRSPNDRGSPSSFRDVKPTLAQLNAATNGVASMTNGENGNSHHHYHNHNHVAASTASSTTTTTSATRRMSIGSILAPAQRANGHQFPPGKANRAAQPPLFLMTSDSSMSLMLPTGRFRESHGHLFHSVGLI